MEGLARAIVETNEDILLACVIDGNRAEDVYIRPGIPLPNGWRSKQLLLHTRILMSIVLTGQDYMGKLKFVHIRMKNADGLHFSLGGEKIFAVMLKPQPVMNPIIETLHEKLEKLIAEKS